MDSHQAKPDMVRLKWEHEKLQSENYQWVPHGCFVCASTKKGNGTGEGATIHDYLCMECLREILETCALRGKYYKHHDLNGPGKRIGESVLCRRCAFENPQNMPVEKWQPSTKGCDICCASTHVTIHINRNKPVCIKCFGKGASGHEELQRELASEFRCGTCAMQLICIQSAFKMVCKSVCREV